MKALGLIPCTVSLVTPTSISISTSVTLIVEVKKSKQLLSEPILQLCGHKFRPGRHNSMQQLGKGKQCIRESFCFLDAGKECG